MNLAIFGATGGTGRQLVEQALEEGHTVTVLVRNPAAFPMQYERLSLVQGDVRDRARVETVVAVMAMTRSHVRRLLVVSAYGAAESHHRDLYNLLLWTLLKEKMMDKERMEELITRSNVDWTLIRPSFLTDGPRTRQYRSGPDLRMHVASHISRADVAAYMLQRITDTASVHKALAITA